MLPAPRLPIVGCMVCVFALDGNGCSQQERFPGKKSNGDVLLRVVEVVFSNERLRTARETTVDAEGNYQRTIYNLREINPPPAQVLKGYLSESIIHALRQDLSRKTGFEIVDGIPTYRFDPDNNFTTHPAGISKLLTIAENDEARNNRQKGAAEGSDK